MKFELKLFLESFVMVSVDSFPLTRRSVLEQLAYPTGKVMLRSLSSALHYTFDSVLHCGNVLESV